MHMFRKQSDNLGTAILIDNARCAEEARIRLTVFAVADGSSGLARGHDIALKRATATSKWMVHAAGPMTSAVRDASKTNLTGAPSAMIAK
jgi:hypothetical protein